MSQLLFKISMLSSAMPRWYHPVRYTLLGIIVVLALFMLAVVLLQPGNTQGLGAISGGAETFFGKNKAKTIEGKLRKLTVIAAVALMVLCVAFALLGAFYR